MDKLDEAILSLLRLNARESVAQIARQTDASRSTVQDRIRRLETNGTIRGYGVHLGDKTDVPLIRAFVSVSIEPQKTGMIIAELKTMNSVSTVHTVSGKFDLHVEIATPDTTKMDQTLDRVSEIPGVIRTETSIVLSTKVKR